jgi:hypothetical protein
MSVLTTFTSPSIRKAPTIDTHLIHTAAVFSMESQYQKSSRCEAWKEVLREGCPSGRGFRNRYKNDFVEKKEWTAHWE